MLCAFAGLDHLLMIQEFQEDGFRLASPSDASSLVGETFNLRWLPGTDPCEIDGEDSEEIASIGGVCLISDFREGRYFARNSPYRGGNPGPEFQLPEQFLYDELNERQRNAFVKPKEVRVRAERPPSLCPLVRSVANATSLSTPLEGFGNFPISDPENSFLSKEDLTETQVYFTHDNGGRPFMVLAHFNAIEVYVDQDEPIWDEVRIYNRLLCSCTDFLGIWPGYDAADYSEFQVVQSAPIRKRRRKVVRRVKRRKVRKVSAETDDVREDGENEDKEKEDGEKGVQVRHCSRADYGQIHRVNGNTLLIQLTPTQYLHVGGSVFSFETERPIENYYSPLGNNDVPYPVAYDSEGVYFFEIERVCYVRKEQLVTPMDLKGADRLFSEFYGHFSSPKKDLLKVKNFELLHGRVD